MKKNKEKKRLNLNGILIALMLISSAFCGFNMHAQDPLMLGPGPVTSISPPPAQPAPGPGAPPPAPPAEGWVSPGWQNAPNNPDWQNQGSLNVMACGYDAQGVWRVIPLFVSYVYNGVQYNVTVVNAWNPWTDYWNTGVNVPAFNTTYFLNGVTYNFYTQLSTGTYYFNL